jgi:hypothetical protein
MHQLQQLADQLDWRVCANSLTERRRDHEWNVGLHVLGGGMSIDATGLYCAAEFV